MIRPQEDSCFRLMKDGIILIMHVINGFQIPVGSWPVPSETISEQLEQTQSCSCRNAHE
jgi:hypothetical protein